MSNNNPPAVRMSRRTSPRMKRYSCARESGVDRAPVTRARLCVVAGTATERRRLTRGCETACGASTRVDVTDPPVEGVTSSVVACARTSMARS